MNSTRAALRNPAFRELWIAAVNSGTGNTKGIGEVIVRRFVEDGAHVVFSARSQEKSALRQSAIPEAKENN
jgi:NADP-dependent 3-hydroxy acid dehydrogenase YdfG